MNTPRTETLGNPTFLPSETTADTLSAGLARRKARRKLWLAVHLWLGLALGLLLALFGATGSILVFYEEIDTLLEPTLFAVAARPQGAAAFRPLAEILAAAEQQKPSGAQLRTVGSPPEDAGTYRLFYEKTVADGSESWQLYVDPYTATVTGQRLIKGADDWVPCCLIPFVFQLHYALLAGDTGIVVVGILAVAMVFSVLTGLIVWWPLTGKWQRALTIKPRAGVERFNHDLHQTSGFYTALVLLAVLVSGVYMNLPKQFVALVRAFSPETRDAFSERPHSGAAAGRLPIGLEQALAVARQRHPAGRPNWFSLPENAAGIYVISYKDVPGLSRFWSEREVRVDQYSGAIVDVRDPSTRRSAGDTFLDWQWPLHSGKAFGWTGRMLVFVTGLACPLLFVTGLVRWLQKRRAQRHGGQGRRIAGSA